MLPLRIVWSWRARTIASALAAVSVAVTVWAVVDPKSSAWVVIGGGLLAAVTACMALETYVYRVEGDAAGLRRRSLRGPDALAWSEVRGVRLVDSRHNGLAIVHTRTGDLDAAFHLRLLTESRGTGSLGSPSSRRPWNFNAWMVGFDELRALVAEHEWPRLDEPVVEESPRLAKVLVRLSEANEIGTQIAFGFALFFVVFMASVAILVEVDLTGNFLLDLVLVAGALLAGAGLVDALVKSRGARLMAQEDASDRERRTLWLANAASLIGGVLVLVAFVPRALAGGPNVWVDWILVGMGAMALLGALRP
ncbi:hypothetical protein [Nannocystis radixulma]|uniref:PH domain-containing protein n=1 Tax=Nannocystis radixulma TaxID=2995305 RepID=A0ABT5BDR1_9BACT|nr:hypothetical protein [Nannocystis radixulma]MDC0672285.1 hypothetical protein [Nannocystis radixulma]